MNLLAAFLFLISISLFPYPTSPEQNTGSIEGTVINEAGEPVKGATAFAHPMDRPMVGIVPQAVTDETGHFVIRNLQWGKWSVSGAKENEKYPNLNMAFYDGMRKRIRLWPN